jgi:hypothetical protein
MLPFTTKSRNVRGAKIPSAVAPGQLNFVPWRILFGVSFSIEIVSYHFSGVWKRLATGWTVRGSIPGGGGKILPHPSRPAPRPAQTPIQRVPGLLPGVKQPMPGVDHPPSSAEVKERVELYLYSSSGPWWHVRGRTLPPPCKRFVYRCAKCNLRLRFIFQINSIDPYKI